MDFVVNIDNDNIMQNDKAEIQEVNDFRKKEAENIVNLQSKNVNKQAENVNKQSDIIELKSTKPDNEIKQKDKEFDEVLQKGLQQKKEGLQQKQETKKVAAKRNSLFGELGKVKSEQKTEAFQQSNLGTLVTVGAALSIVGMMLI